MRFVLRTPYADQASGAPQRTAGPSSRWLFGGLCLVAGAIIAAATVPAIAATSDTTATYNACVTSTTGTIKIVSPSTACAGSQRRISWDNQASAVSPDIPKAYAKGFYSVLHLTNSLQTVVSLNLPTGSGYIVTAKTEIAGGTAPADVGCRLVGATPQTQYDVSAVSASPNSFAELTDIAGVSSGGTAALQCQELGTTTHGYIAQSGYITAIPATSITGP